MIKGDTRSLDCSSHRVQGLGFILDLGICENETPPVAFRIRRLASSLELRLQPQVETTNT